MGTGVYETTFTLTEAQAKAAPKGFRLDLGDVRESARVYVNGDSVATLWAVPFTIDLPCNAEGGHGTLHTGQNTLRIEVTNLPANRISQMDRDGVVWRLFEDVNILGIQNGSEGSRVESYASWSPMPSGLNSNVRLLSLLPDEPRLETILHEMRAVENEGGTLYWPVYRVTSSTGQMASATLTTTDGTTPIEASLSISEDGTWLTLCPQTAPEGHDNALLTVTTTDGATLKTWLPLEGAYTLTLVQPFNGTEAPASGWSNAVKNGLAITGFAADGKVEAHTATAKGTVVSNLYEGFVINSASSNTFYLFPGYGMQPLRDCTISPTDPQQLRTGDIMLLAKRVGNTTESISLNDVATTLDKAVCTHAPNGFSLKMNQRANGILYEGIAIYRPLKPVATTSTAIATPRQDKDNAQTGRNTWYNLQGQRVAQPTRPGIYLRGGSKIIVR
jgi:hypothetical protein